MFCAHRRTIIIICIYIYIYIYISFDLILLLSNPITQSIVQNGFDRYIARRSMKEGDESHNEMVVSTCVFVCYSSFECECHYPPKPSHYPSSLFTTHYDVTL